MFLAWQPCLIYWWSTLKILCLYQFMTGFFEHGYGHNCSLVLCYFIFLIFFSMQDAWILRIVFKGLDCLWTWYWLIFLFSFLLSFMFFPASCFKDEFSSSLEQTSWKCLYFFFIFFFFACLLLCVGLVLWQRRKVIFGLSCNCNFFTDCEMKPRNLLWIAVGSLSLPNFIAWGNLLLGFGKVW